ncbi:MAG TPA: NAD(P)H-hydrate epimerase [Phycisphaerales bacterium]|nr:NAD(P)H-hydrate epimerase [Phycisphaerales bacterium]
MKKYQREKNSDFKVMTCEQVRGFDRYVIEKLSVPSVVLMENAGRSCAELVAGRLNSIENAKVCVFCGTGNNGGDGFVIARHLVNRGAEVAVVICGDRGKISGDARINLDIIENMKLSITEMDISGQVESFVSGCDIVVDAILGTGLAGQLREPYIELIKSINACGIEIIAVDIPSGLDCDSGSPLGAAIKAAATVTFVAVKTGFAENKDSVKYTGDIYVASIGVEP